MYNENPYQTTVLGHPISKRTRHQPRLGIVLWWLSFLYPVITMSMIYVTWIITTLSLGRPPNFGEMPVHPSAEMTAMLVGNCGALLTMASPMLIPIGMVMAIAWPLGSNTHKLWHRLTCLGSYLVLLAIVTTLCFYDPLNVLFWFWD